MKIGGGNKERRGRREYGEREKKERKKKRDGGSLKENY